MGFKDILFSDIQNTFMDPEEFGEVHMIDKKRMTVIIDGNEVTERSKKQVEQGRIDGIFMHQIVMYVPKKEFGPLPARGRILSLDNNNFRIMDAIDEGGIFSITLGAVKS